MDIQEAVEATVTVNPHIVMLMHRLKADPQELKDRLDARSDIEVVALQIGEVYELK